MDKLIVKAVKITSQLFITSHQHACWINTECIWMLGIMKFPTKFADWKSSSLGKYFLIVINGVTSEANLWNARSQWMSVYTPTCNVCLWDIMTSNQYVLQLSPKLQISPQHSVGAPSAPCTNAHWQLQGTGTPLLLGASSFCNHMVKKQEKDASRTQIINFWSNFTMAEYSFACQSLTRQRIEPLYLFIYFIF